MLAFAIELLTGAEPMEAKASNPLPHILWHGVTTRPQLLLLVGELDTNVDPATTMQVVNALIKANKTFDLLVIPGGSHGMGGAYGTRKLYDFFVHHLLGIDPPHWNAIEADKEKTP